MRHTISKWIAALAVMAAGAGASPAMACGGVFASGGCSPCGQAYASPCGGYGVGYGYAGTGVYERLPDPTPVTRQYFYADQGPTFSGPGMFAPIPTYQETALGFRGYGRQDYGYRRGPYANPVNYAYGPSYGSAAVYHYGPRIHYRARSSYRYGYSMQPRARYGYAHRSQVARMGYQQSHRYAAPRVMYAPRHGVQQGYGHPQRRLY